MDWFKQGKADGAKGAPKNMQNAPAPQREKYDAGVDQAKKDQTTKK